MQDQIDSFNRDGHTHTQKKNKVKVLKVKKTVTEAQKILSGLNSRLTQLGKELVNLKEG